MSRDPDMRFCHRAILGILIVLSFCLSPLNETAHGQTSQIDNAQTQLVHAFTLVQQADFDGAPPSQIALLATDLNQALAYEENATQLSLTNITLSNYYANRSQNLSNTTSNAAFTLSSNARGQAFYNQFGIYTIALVAGLGLAFIATESHRIIGSFRKVRLRRARFE